MVVRPQQWLEKIQALNFGHIIGILNVCGGHERTISHSGLRSLLPENIQLIPGPGCPVCVCPAEEINRAISLSKNSNIILACFGDMINVPANNKKQEIQSLKQARALGHNVVAVSSPAEVLKLAGSNPDKTIVFFVAGFETTLAPIAAMIDQLSGVDTNIKFLIAGRKTWPVVESLLADSKHKLRGIIAPGHVATIMGANEWQFISENHQLACAVSGFTIDSVLASIYSVLMQIKNKENFLDNCYKETVTSHGNQTAKKLLDKCFEVDDALWRGVGIIENSGFFLKSKYSHLDAVGLIENDIQQSEKPDTPAGCDCPGVTMGKIFPTDCVLFNKACTPANPVGACMVSDEGACNIWWHNGEHLRA